MVGIRPRIPLSALRLQPGIPHRLNLRPPPPTLHPSARLSIRFNSQFPPPRDPLHESSRSSPNTTDTPPRNDQSYGGTFDYCPIERGPADPLDKMKQAAKTPTKWYPIPIALGAIVLLAVQFRKQIMGGSGDGAEVATQGPEGAVLKSRKVDGPWQVRVLGALPLRSLSQLWGYLNGLVLPVWFRPYGFRLYSYIFGCDLSEVPLDLKEYRSLGEFFYREIREGARPISEAPMVSPADGRVLHFGEITGERVEQVKGITYSLGALLGQDGQAVGEQSEVVRNGQLGVQMVDDENFASINDIPYSIDKLMGSGRETKEERVTRRKWIRWGIGGEGWKFWKRIGGKPKDGEAVAKVIAEGSDAAEESTPKRSRWAFWRRSSGNTSSMAADESDDTTTELTSETTSDGVEVDASVSAKSGDVAHDASVAISLGSSALSAVTERGRDLKLINPKNRLYFMVVYLAPGDYHRFHSPTAWVVERRRHFTGDLFSVSPYIANRLSNLFVLNERVALLGRWKYGFYSMVPVGATNVGSIMINFDENLRTNTRKLSHPAYSFTEAVYTSASKILQGQPLLAGEEMGGFKLGSTIVMVFEAPKNWKFTVNAGDKVKVGQELGRLEELKA